MRSLELQTNSMYSERLLQCGTESVTETYSPPKNILNSDVTSLHELVFEGVSRQRVCPGEYDLHPAVVLYHRFATAVELYLRNCCGIVTFAVELYLRFAMELLVIFGASFQ